jgi:hypothetical protein
MSGSRGFLATFFAGLALVIAATASVNFVVDPLHYYRGVNAINHVFFSGYQRYQNVGLARSFHYDTVVIGPSVTENFLPSYIERTWGGRAMKLSISGSTSYEQLLILQQAIATGQVARVLWGLHIPAFYGGPRRVDEQAPFPYFMYRGSALFNLEYPLSLSTLRLAVRVLRGLGETDLDSVDTWYHLFQFGERAVLASWSGSCELFKHKYQPDRQALPEAAIAEMQEAVRKNLAATVRANRRITFNLFLPPLALLAYVPADTGLLTYALPFRRYIAQEVAGDPNVRLFDFQTMPALNDDLGRYKDPSHFDLDTSEYLIDAMRDGIGRVDRRQLMANDARLIDEVNSYDLCRVRRPLAQHP